MSPPIKKLFFLLLLLYAVSLKSQVSKGLDTITSIQSLTGNETISSQNGTFELGFFTPSNSQNYYIGIWYKGKPDKTVVWVANRDHPILHPQASELKLFPNGNLVLVNHSQHQIWSTNSTSKFANSTIAELLDSGNFIVREKSDVSNVILWQSFDYPTDTWLPGGKIGYNKLRNEKQILISWKSQEDPGSSLISFGIDPNRTESFLMWNEAQMYWSSWEWSESYVTNITHVSNENESYFTYGPGYSDALVRFLIDEWGQLKLSVWFPGVEEMYNQLWFQPPGPCRGYSSCGAFGSAFGSCDDVGFPTCTCMSGFEPRSPRDWELGNHADGCIRKIPLTCIADGNESNDTFTVVPSKSFPRNPEPFNVGSRKECESACLKNCSCSAYAYENGCLVWHGELIDLIEDYYITGRDFHVRVAPSGVGMVVKGFDRNRKTKTKMKTKTKTKTKNKFVLLVMWTIGGFSSLLAVVLVTILIRRKRRKKSSTFMTDGNSLIVFRFRDLKIATKNFAEKLGEGGFGSVFKGTLQGSSGTIAVKRLKNLNQEECHNDKQFRAEVSTIGLIQHVNLVRLVGFCVEGSKRFLVYDFMPKGSLESHLFGRMSDNVLNWKTRYNIILGTARGLAYLHEKCHDCIIHCDIKPDNILLDSDFNPMVADFGLAKLMGRRFSRVLTTMRGTIGYLAPEWISDVAITPKVDVFSYGMMLFEIISGRRNREPLNDGSDDYFPARVANRVSQGEGVVNLLDPRLEGYDVDIEEVTIVCRIACWCIQDDEKYRPTMGLIVQILEGVSDISIPPVPRFLDIFWSTLD